jgi:hypothetical protein
MSTMPTTRPKTPMGIHPGWPDALNAPHTKRKLMAQMGSDAKIKITAATKANVLPVDDMDSLRNL